MSPWEQLWLALAGVVMGFVNNLAGGGGLLGLAALEGLAGLDPIAANAALRPSAVAIGGMGLIGFLTKNQRISARSFAYGLACVPGAVLGSILLVELPAFAYQIALAAVVVAMLVGQLRPSAPKAASVAPRPGGLTAALLFSLVGLHMGFVQVGVGLLIMLALQRVHSQDLVQVNVVKAAIVLCTAPASLITLSVGERVAWSPALTLATGCGVGSFLASRWALSAGHRGVRAVVLLVCAGMLVRVLAQILGLA